MPGFVVDLTSIMTCPHGGKVTFVPVGPPTVFVNGAAALTAADQITVVGCIAVSPCVKVQWANFGSALINGVPVMLQAPPTPPGPGGGACLGGPPVPPVLVAMQAAVVGT
ncbi:hypothetical protein MJO55_06095 [Mycolicibacterium rufum]|uniref:PAAR motif-containing protein n=1 Tax=Mycolicibacterium rufum TaxID=318424 RepID=A0A9X3BF94_9MYCO|nr:hypothetical protein [Mycolicibacterium rufum]KGI67130.1 hypothetical protein EU78_06270 [Mycolicibacterium rufum]MCV7070119.1 hypothetical protein [Mycolicibacterium rufum]ULP37997.1 hypothetical protein MJO55_06095 [Mycolicibacterium rufum]